MQAVNASSAPTTQTSSVSSIEREVTRFNSWRDRLIRAVHEYHDWLESSNQLDIQQSVRFYDLIEHLNRGKLMIAFLAEYSRGKSELINALFFSSFKERLIPSDVGRTTMCPTEIFHDPNDEPYLKLLSIETRYRDESISQLKTQPLEWSKIRLNVNSAADMKVALKALCQTKKVYALEARMMGFPANVGAGEEETVEVPAWRYAMLNFPHPLLTNGLAILDTPGLNAMGLEPELTLNAVPNAHAVLFLLSIDTGVSKSDMEMWERYVKQSLPMKTAVLNKIDLMWDDLKSSDEIAAGIARQLSETAKALEMSPGNVFPISAQKALIGRIKGDHDLVKRSGILHLERFLAEEVIPSRRQILSKAVINELGAALMGSRSSIMSTLTGKEQELRDIESLAGKSKDVVAKMWAKVGAERQAYNDALSDYKGSERTFNQKRAALLDALNAGRFEFIVNQARKSIDDSWMTHSLLRGMNSLTKSLYGGFDEITVLGEELKTLMLSTYLTFCERFGLETLQLPPLDLDEYRDKLRALVSETKRFCSDPVNIATPENMLRKRFFAGIVDRTRQVYDEARSEVERWIEAVTTPITGSLRNHKQQIEQRMTSLKELNEKSGSLEVRITQINAEMAKSREELYMIDQLIAVVKQPFSPEADAKDALQGPAASPLDSATSTLTKAVQLLTGRRR
jgi:hypothetical protein